MTTNLFLIYFITMFMLVVTILGNNWVSLILIVITVFIIAGSSLIINPKAFNLVSLFGCVFIAYMAICAIEDFINRKNSQLVVESTKLTTQNIRGAGTLKYDGAINRFLVELSSPQDIIFFVAFFPQFIKIMASFNNNIFLLTLLWILLNVLIWGSYTIFMRKMTSYRGKKLTTLIVSVVLLAVAIMGFIYSLMELTI